MRLRELRSRAQCQHAACATHVADAAPPRAFCALYAAFPTQPVSATAPHGAAGVDAAQGAPKGESIWVAVRLRPLNELELYRARDVAVWVAAPDGRTLRFDAASAGLPPGARPAAGPATYTFDRVFAPNVSNDEVYKEAASPLVRSAMAGVNGTLFAYGQTGGGKTFTMKAIMEAATAEVFEVIKATPGREYLLRISALEIYNEVRHACVLCLAAARAPRRASAWRAARRTPRELRAQRTPVALASAHLRC